MIVDAAFQCFPVSSLGAGRAPVTSPCFSAKYFGGRTAAGSWRGRLRRCAISRRWTSSGYECGPWRTFGRAFKLDRATVVATVAALEEWVGLDHEARRAGYASLAGRLAGSVGGSVVSVHARRASVGRRAVQRGLVPGAVGMVGALAGGDPSVRAMADGDDLVLCMETVSSSEIEEIAAAMSAHCQN